MKKIVTSLFMVCSLCVFLTACSNLGTQNSSGGAVVSLELPAALFSEIPTDVTEYTVDAVLKDADTSESIESLSKTVISGGSVTFTFSPVQAGRAVVLSINVYDGTTLYMSGKSNRYVVVEGDQSIDITLTTTSGETTTGTGTITGKAGYADGKTSNEGIVVFIEKTDTPSADSDSPAVTNAAAVRTVSARSAATGTTSNYFINDAVAIAKTDSTGSFKFSGLAAGSYAVYAVSDTSVEKAAYDTVTITDGGSGTVTLTLTATGNITGTVQLDGNTTGNSGIFVYVPNSSYIAVTDDSGNFTIYNIPVSSTAYTLAAKYGSTIRTFTADSSDTLVTAGGTAAAGTMSFATTEKRHYLTDSSGTISTTNYVQATKDGLKFVLTDMPSYVAALGFGFEGYTDASGTYHASNAYYNVDKVDYSKGITEQDDITHVIYTYHLVVPNVTYKNIFAITYNSKWTKVGTYTADSVASVGGYGTISVSNPDKISLNWDPDTFTLSSKGVPEVDFSTYTGSDIASDYCEIQIAASDGTTSTISEQSHKEMSVVFGDELSADMLQKICGKSDVKMTLAYKIKLKEDLGDIRPNSSIYNIYYTELTNQTVNAFTPALTVDANGGTITDKAGNTYSTLKLSKDNSGNAFTTETTFADIQTAWEAAYTLSYTAGGVTADENGASCTDSSGKVISLSDSTAALGYTNYKVVFHWTLPLTASSWSGTYETKDSENTINLSTALWGTSTTAALTITATGEPSVYYYYSGTSKNNFYPTSSSDGTYTYTVSNSSSPLYISGSNITITAVTFTPAS